MLLLFKAFRFQFSLKISEIDFCYVNSYTKNFLEICINIIISSNNLLKYTTYK